MWQNTKQPSPIVVIDFGITTELKKVLENARFPSVVTDAGIFKVERRVL
jgi:hypothetical protein